MLTEPVGLLGTLIERWRKQAMDSREESGRIRRTIKEATGAEERCLVRAEVWDKVADELEVAKWKLEDAAALPPAPPPGQLENRDIPLSASELTELVRRLVGPNDPHPAMTKQWAAVAIQQLLGNYILNSLVSRDGTIE